MINKIKKTLSFLKTDLWRVSLKDVSKVKAIILNVIRIFSLAFRGYKDDKIQQKASALTFYSLLSIVPVVAIGFGIAKGFGLDQMFVDQLYERFAGQEEVMKWILKFSDAVVNNTKGGVITGLGIVVLFWSVIKVLGNIENSFNDIWQVQKSRVFVRKLSDYLAIFIIAFMFLISSNGIIIFIQSQIKSFANQYEVISYFNSVLFFLLKLLPYLLMCVLFSLLYMVMPNTKVSIKSGILAGFVAGIAFQLAQWGLIYFQVGASKYGAIYGSFAAFPLFLVWLQLSWLIVLFGAEISFASQNVHRYEYESDTLNISLAFKKTITLFIASILIKNFEVGKKGITASLISHEYKIPIRLVRQILYELVDSNIVVETISENLKEHAYQPCIDIHKLSVGYVVNSIEDSGSKNISVKRTKEFEKIENLYSSYKDKWLNADENILLKDI
jgi:membrane protein